jgi:hypothetical protein
MIKYLPLVFTLYITSCSILHDPNYHITSFNQQNNFSLFFSHNVAGEIASCGCSKFPLGGMDRLYATFVNSKTTRAHPHFYVDTGDAYFNRSVIPDNFKQSALFTAKELAKLQSKIPLSFFTPGDRDFALGIKVLNELIQLSGSKAVLTNNRKLPINSHPYSLIKLKDYHVLILGVLQPSLLPTKTAQLLDDPIQAISKQLKNLPSHINTPIRVLILAHADDSEIEKIAKSVAGIDWIIGSNDSRLEYEPLYFGKTKSVQLLNRNQYLGAIHFTHEKQTRGQYEVLALDSGKEKLINPNPITPLIINYETNLARVQSKELNDSLPEKKTSFKNNLPQNHKLVTDYRSCVDCHQKQTEFWQATSHAQAYITLAQEGQELNANCVHCHSQLEKNDSLDMLVELKKKRSIKEYMTQFKQALAKTPFPDQSIRTLSNKQRLSLFEHMSQFEKSENIVKTHYHVQCLSCHKVATDHPFQFDTEQNSKDRVKFSLSQHCLNCHDSTNSPDWYRTPTGDMAKKAIMPYVEKQIKKISCPPLDHNQR